MITVAMKMKNIYYQKANKMKIFVDKTQNLVVNVNQNMSLIMKF